MLNFFKTHVPAAFLALMLCAGQSRAQVISTIAGNGVSTLAGDNGPALNAQLTASKGMAFDGQGNLFLCQVNRIRKIDVNGVITTIAGNGTAGYSGDGGPATAALLSGPADIAADASGNIFFSDEGNARIRRIDVTTGNINTIAGGGIVAGDGIPALSAILLGPRGLAFDPAGDLYFADHGSSRIRKVNMTTGIITTVAGGGSSIQEGVLAVNSSLSQPSEVAFAPNGDMYIADGTNFRLRKVDASGIINTVAGSAFINGYPPIYAWTALSAVVGEIVQVVADADGSVYFACGQDVAHAHAVFRLAPSGVLYYYGGTSNAAFTGDGGYVGFARFNSVSGLAISPTGQLHIADGGNYRIRKITNSCIYPVTPLLSNGSNWVCRNVTDTFAITVDTSVLSYTWMIPYNWTGSSNTNTIIVGTDTSGGNISVYGTNSCGNGLPMILAVFSSPFTPTMYILPGAEICQGDVVQLSIISGSTFQWFENGNAIPGANGNVYHPTQPGTYSVYASDGSCAAMSNDTTIIINPAPYAELTDTTSACFDSTQILHITGDTGLTYQWYNYGQSVSLTPDTFYQPTVAGSYSFVATNSYGCTYVSDTVHLFPTPSPAISQFGNWLSVPAIYSSYQWYLNGVAITGAISNTYLTTVNGTYQVEVVENGCPGYSDTVYAQPVSVSTEGAVGAFSIYPNPVKEEAVLEFSGLEEHEYTFTLYDLRGAMVKQVPVPHTCKLLIKREALLPGVYYFELRTDHTPVGRGKLLLE